MNDTQSSTNQQQEQAPNDLLNFLQKNNINANVQQCFVQCSSKNNPSHNQNPYGPFHISFPTVQKGVDTEMRKKEFSKFSRLDNKPNSPWKVVESDTGHLYLTMHPKNGYVRRQQKFSHPALQYKTIDDSPYYAEHNVMVDSIDFVITDKMVKKKAQLRQFEQKVIEQPTSKKIRQQITNAVHECLEAGWPCKELLVNNKHTVCIKGIPLCISADDLWTQMVNNYKVTIVYMSDELSIDSDNTSCQECNSLTLATKEQRNNLIALSERNQLKMKWKNGVYTLMCIPNDQTQRSLKGIYIYRSPFIHNC